MCTSNFLHLASGISAASLDIAESVFICLIDERVDYVKLDQLGLSEPPKSLKILGF